MAKDSWMTPFFKQCFVTLGQSLAIGQLGLVFGFTATLLPELRKPDSIIFIDDDAGSWIVSVPIIVCFITPVFTPFLMGRCGRRPAIIISLIFLIISWLLITSATSLPCIIIGRMIQGFCFGVIYCASPVCIGEYTSPKNRGAFLASLSLSMACGTMTAHILGSYLTWQRRAFFCSIITFVNLIIVMYSPETPSWLINKGKYEDGKEAFQWLRGGTEDEELKKMIEADILMKDNEVKDILDHSNSLQKVKKYIEYVRKTIKKPEFYKPIFIMINLNAVLQFSGVNLLASYANDILKNILDEDVDIDLIIVSADVQRLITNFCAMFFIKKFKRKTVLVFTVLLNAIVYITISGYIYGKSNDIIREKSYIGIILVHLLMFCIASGTVPLPMIISGEIFSLEYRSLASVISLGISSPLTFVLLKSFSFLLLTLGLDGLFCLYAGVLVVCLIMACLVLPETKDKTLQEIEEEFKGKSTIENLETIEALTVTKN